MPCDYSKYPKEWKKVIRPAILKRAGNKCEVCGIENGAVGWRDSEGKFHYTEAYLKTKERGFGFYQTSGFLKIVLTISHLDHDVTNNNYENLKAMCQRDHLLHDAEHHKKNRAETKRKKQEEDKTNSGIIELPFTN